MQAQSCDADQRLGAAVGLLHDVAVHLVPLVQWLAQKLLDQRAELIALASEVASSTQFMATINCLNELKNGYL